jgi:hypothetical protein
VLTISAEVFLISVRISAITIKAVIVVAFRAGKLVYFHHENISPFGRYRVLW